MIIRKRGRLPLLKSFGRTQAALLHNTAKMPSYPRLSASSATTMKEMGADKSQHFSPLLTLSGEAALVGPANECPLCLLPYVLELA